MKNLSKIAMVIASSLLVASCASNSESLINSPSLFSRLTKANLTTAPTDNRRGNTYSVDDRQNDRKVEKFLGKKDANFKKFTFQGAKKTGAGYSLNFNNAKLSELAKVILWDTLNIPYFFDPRVTGEVTLATGKSISREELLFTLETILQMNNAAMVKEGNLYRVVPQAIAQSGGTVNVDYASESQRVGPGYGITIFPLKYVSTDAMRKILSSFTNKQNGLDANIEGNMLFIRGPGRERKTLVELALTFDVDWMKGQSAGIYVLENTAPDEIIPDLQNVFKTKNGRGKGIVRFQSINRLNAIMVLTENPEFIDKVEVWVKRLDRANGAAENLFVYRVENGKAKDLADILNQMFSGQASASVDTASSIAPGQQANRLTSTSLQGDSSQSNQSNSLSSSDGDNSSNNSVASSSATSSVSTSSVSSGGSSASGKIKIIPDEVNNKILIRASNRDYRRIAKVLKRIDKPPLQVMINATLAEVTLNDQLKYGVQFFLQKGGGSKGAISFSTGNTLQVAANQFPGLNFVLGSITQPKVVLDALSSETNVKVVSSPSVVVLHNQTASLQVGDEVPIATRQSTSVTDTQAPIVNEIRFRKTGVILKVTPRVSSNGLVTMEIDQEISSVNNVTAVGDNGSGGTLTPTISQRRVSSTIAVNSGQMVVLGGLISERDNDAASGIPGLKEVPVVGKVVGASNNKGKMRTELVIFLQPTVIRNAQDAATIAENVRSSLSRFAPTPKERRELRERRIKQEAAWKTVDNRD